MNNTAQTAPRRPRGRPPGIKRAETSASPSAPEPEMTFSAPEKPIEMISVSRESANEPPRHEMRAPMREEDPRTRAAKRAAELRGHLGDMDEGPDDFYIDKDAIPQGWDYEWKTRTVLGAEDPAYQVQLARKGWEPVPASRHPSYMPQGSKSATIERKGMVLMERPLEITEEARDIELKKARNQVRQKEAQLNSAPEGQFERNHPSVKAKITKTIEAMPIPKD